MLLLTAGTCSAASAASLPVHLQQIHSLMGSSDPEDQDDNDDDNDRPPSSVSELLALLSFFHTETAPAGRRLWRQGDHSDCALLLVGR